MTANTYFSTNLRFHGEHGDSDGVGEVGSGGGRGGDINSDRREEQRLDSRRKWKVMWNPSWGCRRPGEFLAQQEGGQDLGGCAPGQRR